MTTWWCDSCGELPAEGSPRPAEERQRLECCGRYLRLCTDCKLYKKTNSHPVIPGAPWVEPSCKPCSRKAPDAVRK